MKESNRSLNIATRLSYLEPPADVFADLCDSLTEGRMSPRTFIECCDTALMVFHVPYEVRLKGAEACTKLARKCLEELASYKYLFDGPDVKDVKVHGKGKERIGGFSIYIAGAFAGIIGSHIHFLKTDEEKLEAVKFTLNVLWPYGAILEHTFNKLAAQATDDDAETEKLVSILEKATADLSKEHPTPPAHAVARPELKVVGGKGVSL